MNQHPVGMEALGIALAMSGRTGEAREIYGTTSPKVPPLYQAMAHASLGEEDAAIDALDRSAAERGDWMYSIGTQPPLRELRSNARFLRLLERLELPPPATGPR